ncbi:MAG: SDR family NAD(P)-dependent oxidoreductase [Ruminiclostridium sp.]
MEKLLEGMRCVVTGASRGIGRAIALAYAKCGADVVITYVSNKNKADEAVAEMESCGVKAYAVKCDAGNEDDTKALAAFIAEKLGSIDVLVNNAGAIGEEMPITEITSDEWDRIMRIDVKGVFLAIKYLVPLFAKNTTGKIINISSELSVKGRANYVHYTAAKGAVNAMTRSLALELAPHILVNTVAPGPIETDMILQDMSTEWVEKEKNIPLGRLGNVSDISAISVLLASKYGEFYCGQFISPNGGAVFI